MIFASKKGFLTFSECGENLVYIDLHKNIRNIFGDNTVSNQKTNKI